MVGGGQPCKAEPGSLLSGSRGHFSALLVSYTSLPPTDRELSRLLPCAHSSRAPEWWVMSVADPWPDHTRVSKADSRHHCASHCGFAPTQFKEGWYLIFNYSLLFLIITGFKFCFWIRNDNKIASSGPILLDSSPGCVEKWTLLKQWGLKWGKQKNCFVVV